MKQKKIDIAFYAFILFMFLFGIYKNGFYVKIYDTLNWFQMVSLIILPFILFGLAFLIGKKLLKVEEHAFKELLLVILGISLGMPWWLVIIIYIALILIVSKVPKKLSISPVLLGLSIFFLSTFLLSYTYLNPIEIQTVSNHFFLAFVGFQPGGLYLSSGLIILIYFLFGMRETYYKKDLTFYSYTLYLLLCFVYSLISKNITIFNFINPNILFLCFVILPRPQNTPTVKLAKILYTSFGIILSFVFEIIFGVFGSTYIVFLFLSLFSYKLDEFTYIMGKKNRSKKQF